VVADANVFCLPDQVLLYTEPEGRNAVLMQIQQFTIADDAVVTDLSDVLITVSVEGPQAEHVLEPVVSTP
jgi:sarcosine oxidase gamma subunit